MTWSVIHGDSVEVLKRFPADTAHALVTDPPGWINFMPKAWDSDKDYPAYLAVLNGFDFVGIERSPFEDDPTDSVAIARARIAHWESTGR